MTKTENTLKNDVLNSVNFKNIHHNNPICFNKECPSCDKCLRFSAGKISPETLRYHLCVVPQALQGERCELFQPVETVKVAYGFSRSYDEVMKRDFTQIRLLLTAYLSNKRGYYKYLRGEWPLMPEQQRYIENVFKSHGYEGKVVYDRTEDVFILEDVPYSTF
ncbi:MAG: hypothetical protein IJB46_09105 [Prevotella sp.]|nr:hypothetical protein [Prevotella sp.]